MPRFAPEPLTERFCESQVRFHETGAATYDQGDPMMARWSREKVQEWQTKLAALQAIKTAYVASLGNIPEV